MDDDIYVSVYATVKWPGSVRVREKVLCRQVPETVDRRVTTWGVSGNRRTVTVNSTCGFCSVAVELHTGVRRGVNRQWFGGRLQATRDMYETKPRRVCVVFMSTWGCV